jgi:hypothetical protein
LFPDRTQIGSLTTEALHNKSPCAEPPGSVIPVTARYFARSLQSAKMNHQSKLVAVVLAVVLVVVPAAVLASCSDGMASMVGTSGMEMVGMVMPPVSATLSTAPDNSCCVVSSADVAVSSALPKSESPATLIAGVPVRRVAQPVRPFIAERTFLASTPPTQAALCVFLI